MLFCLILCYIYATFVQNNVSYWKISSAYFFPITFSPLKASTGAKTEELLEQLHFTQHVTMICTKILLH